MTPFTEFVDFSAEQAATSGWISEGFFCDWINGLNTGTCNKYIISDSTAQWVTCTNEDGKGGEVKCFDNSNCTGSTVPCCSYGNLIGAADQSGPHNETYYKGKIKNPPRSTF